MLTTRGSPNRGSAKMEEVNEKLKNFLITSSTSGVELNCLASFRRHRQELQRNYLHNGTGKYQLILAFLICTIGKHYFSELFANEDVNEPLLWKVPSFDEF